jgi:hypothetical protein
VIKGALKAARPHRLPMIYLFRPRKVEEGVLISSRKSAPGAPRHPGDRTSAAVDGCLSALIGMVSAIDRKHSPLSIGAAVRLHRNPHLLIVSPDSRANLARHQAETPLIALRRSPEPALVQGRAQTDLRDWVGVGSRCSRPLPMLCRPKRKISALTG